MGLQERDLEKRAKIDYLRLTPAEWSRIGQFADLLSVQMTLPLYENTTNYQYYISMPMSLNKPSRLMLAQHFILPFWHSRHSTRPGPPVQDGQSMLILRLHLMLLHRRSTSIMRRQQFLPHMLWPCVRSFRAYIQFSFNFFHILYFSTRSHGENDLLQKELARGTTG